MNSVNKKITFVLPGYITVPMGGVKVVNKLAELLSNRGYDVTLVYPKNMELGFIQLVKSRIKNYLDKKHNVVHELYYHPAPLVDVIVVSEISEKYLPKADYIVAVGWQTAEAINTLSLQKGKKIYFLQSYEAYFADKKKVLATYKLPLQKIAISSWIQKELSATGQKALGPVGNFIDEKEFFPIENVDKFYDVLMLYHPAKIKNASFGFDVLNRLKKQDSKITAAIFTAREPVHKVPEWIKVYVRPEIDQLRLLYNSSKVYFNTSKWEGWGLPPMEAMACGCAVVAVKNKGISEFLENSKNAFVINPKDKISAVEKIRTLLKNDSTRNAYINEGFQTLKKYSADEMANKFEKFLKD